MKLLLFFTLIYAIGQVKEISPPPSSNITCYEQPISHIVKSGRYLRKNTLSYIFEVRFSSSSSIAPKNIYWVSGENICKMHRITVPPLELSSWYTVEIHENLIKRGTKYFFKYTIGNKIKTSKTFTFKEAVDFPSFLKEVPEAQKIVKEWQEISLTMTELQLNMSIISSIAKLGSPCKSISNKNILIWPLKYSFFPEGRYLILYFNNAGNLVKINPPFLPYSNNFEHYQDYEKYFLEVDGMYFFSVMFNLPQIPNSKAGKLFLNIGSNKYLMRNIINFKNNNKQFYRYKVAIPQSEFKIGTPYYFSYENGEIILKSRNYFLFPKKSFSEINKIPEVVDIIGDWQVIKHRLSQVQKGMKIIKVIELLGSPSKIDPENNKLYYPLKYDNSASLKGKSELILGFSNDFKLISVSSE